MHNEDVSKRRQLSKMKGIKCPHEMTENQWKKFLDLQAGVDKDRDSGTECEDKDEAFIEGLLLLFCTPTCRSWSSASNGLALEPTTSPAPATDHFVIWLAPCFMADFNFNVGKEEAFLFSFSYQQSQITPTFQTSHEVNSLLDYSHHQVLIY